jgi:flagellar hook protein FlgE
MGSFSIPLSGLNAAQGELQAISNNLANSSTTGYKDSNLTFSGIFSGASSLNGAGNAIQTGAGVETAASDVNFTEGALTATQTSSNMAISGNGFFLTRDPEGAVTYTRAGDFNTNNSGQIVSPSGGLVLGYPATGGVVNSAGTLGPIQVGSANSPAIATTSFQINANLNASATVGTTANSTLPVYDSLGAAHNLDVTYTNSGPGAWTYTISVPNSDLSTGGTGSTQVASGSLSFNSSGNLVMPGTPPATTIPVTIPPASTPSVTFANGAAPMVMTWNLDDTSGNPTLSQTATASATPTTSQNGFAAGTLSSYAVLPDGTVQGTFSSGQTMALGQVAVANFANTQGLVSVGNSNYQASAASGSATVGVAGTGGRGTVIGGDTEGSNVDIAKEFANLIVAQQTYSANAKALTTLTQVSQATMAMIQ